MQNYYNEARIILDVRQKICLCLLMVALFIAIYYDYEAAKIVFLLFGQVAYLLINLMQGILFYTGWRNRLPAPQVNIAALMASDLPKYTVLLPLYKEAAMLPILVRNINDLIYDRHKLEIFLVLEESDEETQLAAARMVLPSFFKIIIVPDSHPKTKGKACNYALQYATGDILVIYDAEDKPEPTQLLQAVDKFRNSHETVVCLQAYLTIEGLGWLISMFAIEYSKQFQYLLPAMRKYNLLVPLGGTSNHLKTEFLKSISGWDAYNVTEDADLGVRIAASGGHTEILPCQTTETATNTLPAWLKQRRRWHKGFMQTLCVHLRHPLRLWQNIGWVNFLFFIYQFGLLMLLPIITPVLLVIVCTIESDVLQTGMLTLAFGNLLFSVIIYVFISYLILKESPQYKRVFLSISCLAYLCLYIPATIAALWQLCMRPHYWDKTTHTPNT